MSRVYFVVFKDAPVDRRLECGINSVVHTVSTPEVARNGPLEVPSVPGVGINDRLHSTSKLMSASAMEKSV